MEDEPRCPKCGSPSGYRYSIRCVETRVGSWDGTSESAAIDATSPVPATVICLSCKKRVPNPELKGR